MQDLNSVSMVGRLCRDIEVRTTQNGAAVGSMSIAVNRDVKRGDKWESEAGFFDVTLWGKQAEALKPYLVKGQQIAVQGYLRQDTWETEQGKRSRVSIVAENLQLLGGKRDSGTGSSAENSGYAANSGRTQNRTAPRTYEPPQTDGNEFSDDIPF